MDNVRQLRPAPQPEPEVPVEEPLPFSAEFFRDTVLPDTLNLIQDMEMAEGEDEFRSRARVVQQQVAAWPLR